MVSSGKTHLQHTDKPNQLFPKSGSGVTVERTRELLGDEISHLSDQEVFEMLAKYRQLANTFIDLSINKHSSKNSLKDIE